MHIYLIAVAWRSRPAIYQIKCIIMNSDVDMHGARETLFTYFNANAMQCNAMHDSHALIQFWKMFLNQSKRHHSDTCSPVIQL